MLADSEPKEECYHSLNWVKAGKAKQKYVGGGVKQVSNSHVRVKDKAVYQSDVECSYLLRGIYPIIEEWHCTLRRTKPDSTASTQGCASLKEWGDEPHNLQLSLEISTVM